VKEVLKEELAL